jgi:shikimate dehydrogenase
LNGLTTLSTPSKAHSITGETKVCGIIGDPIAHSLSPPIHNAAFRMLGLNFVYIPFRVRRGELAEAIRGIRSLGLVGVNVTMPHKTRVLRFLDAIDKTAWRIGAVNTIARNNGRFQGYNTDGEAALTTLASLGGSLSGTRALILGAGGASRAIAYHLSKTVQEMTILNRTRSTGSRIAAMTKMWCRAKCRSQRLTKANVRKEISRANLLINTLPVGVFPRFARLLIQERLIRQGMLVLDINYQSEQAFLAKAEQAGAKVTDGLDMLVRQAALSFRLWTGRNAPIDIMREAAAQARKI